jgi:hypothetical protein
MAPAGCLISGHGACWCLIGGHGACWCLISWHGACEVDINRQYGACWCLIRWHGACGCLISRHGACGCLIQQAWRLLVSHPAGMAPAGVSPAGMAPAGVSVCRRSACWCVSSAGMAPAGCSSRCGLLRLAAYRATRPIGIVVGCNQPQVTHSCGTLALSITTSDCCFEGARGSCVTFCCCD